MNEQDRQAIEGLFARLADAERQAGPKDAQAEAFIKQQMGAQPGAPYLMAQTIVMQTYALEQAQQRIGELEEQAEAPASSSGGGSFLSGIFGGGSPAPASRPSSVPAAGQRPNFRGGAMQAQPQQGGGFLAGAAQTAMGVAGGVLLGNALGSMFGGGTAQATPAAAAPEAPKAEPAPAEPAAQPEPVADDGGGFFDSDFGGDMDI